MDSGIPTTSGTPERNRFLANSLLLHLRPARVPLRAIRFTHTFGLGGMAMVLVLLLIREKAVALILIALVIILAVIFGAPLGEPANPGLSPNPAKAPWYFLGVQELLLHFHPLFAVVVIPLLFIAALVAVPFLRYEHHLAGGWFFTRRGKRLATVAAIVGLMSTPLLILVDEYLVGPDGWWPGTSPIIS